MRSIPTTAATEAAKQHGAFPVHVLEIRWSSGTVYYCDRELSTPITAQARVQSWGELKIDAPLDRMGGAGQLTVSLIDHDGDLRTKASTSPGWLGVETLVHLWFAGTDWADRVTLFAGQLARGSEYSFATGVWSLRLTGYEQKKLPALGKLVNRQSFPEIDCREGEGQIIPITFGNPVLRVPGVLVDRPGQSLTSSAIDIGSTSFTIGQTPAVSGFPIGTTITVAIGAAGATETFTGSFNSSGLFTFTSRSAIECTGTTQGTYAEAGTHWLLIPRADFANPNNSRVGYPLFLFLNGGWVGYTIDTWTQRATNQAVLNVGSNPIPSGTPYKLGSAPIGRVPNWPAGMEIVELGNWVFAFNHLPSEQITAVEFLTEPQSAGFSGQRRQQWYTLSASNPQTYTVQLNNTSFNTALGRSGGDPGITTVTLTTAPSLVGMPELKLWATLKATRSSDTSGSAIDNPATVIRKLLEHPLLGNQSGKVDTTSFNAAAAAIPTDVKFAFSIDDPKQLHEVCADLARQAGCLYFWDQGKAHLKRLTATVDSGDSVLTLNADNIAKGTFALQDPGTTDGSTWTVSKWKPHAEAKEQRLGRQATSEIAAMGRVRRDIDFWAMQSGEAVRLSTELWTTIYASIQREVSGSTFLNGIKLQPGDVVTLAMNDGNGNSVASGPARLLTLTHRFLSLTNQTIEAIAFTAQLPLWSVTIETAAVTDAPCDPSVGTFAGVDQDGNPLFPAPDGFGTTTTTTTTTTSTSTTSTTTTSTTSTSTTSTTTTTTTTIAPCEGFPIGGVSLGLPSFTKLRSSGTCVSTSPTTISGFSLISTTEVGSPVSYCERVWRTWTSGVPGANDWEVKMRRSASTGSIIFTSATVWEASGDTTTYQSTIDVSAGGSLSLPLVGASGWRHYSNTNTCDGAGCSSGVCVSLPITINTTA